MQNMLKPKYMIVGVGVLSMFLAGYIYLGNITLPIYSHIYKHGTQTAFEEANAQLGSPLSYVGVDTETNKEAPICYYTEPPRAFYRSLGCFIHPTGERVIDPADAAFHTWIDELHRRLDQNQWAATTPYAPSGGTWHTANTEIILSLKSGRTGQWIKYNKRIEGNNCSLGIQTYTKTFVGSTSESYLLQAEMSCGRSLRLP